MADINFTIRHIKKWEGGFVNNPYDPGGATNKGITLNTYKRFCLDNNRPIPSVEEKTFQIKIGTLFFYLIIGTNGKQV